jgi:chromosome segregation protein
MTAENQADAEQAAQAPKPFENGSVWVRADFHLHTKADKEFTYGGKESDFVAEYVKRLKAANICLGVITNHNKFDMGEFKALRKRARKEGIGLFPGVELSVNDGKNGVHTLVVFSDDWLEDGEDYINQFLGVAFAGKTPNQYENENGRSNENLLDTLKALEGFNKDFFIIFAHVEAPSGLWNEIDGGRLMELSQNPLVQKYCLGFQKVRTHDKPDAKCRVKVQGWWERYPAEVEGSDPKKLEEIGRGKQSVFLKLGDYSFDAMKYALTDYQFRVSTEAATVGHSHIDTISFEGGLLDGATVLFSPNLNCLIGIRGSGKSAILEALRYALDNPLGSRRRTRITRMPLCHFCSRAVAKLLSKPQIATERSTRSTVFSTTRPTFTSMASCAPESR